MAHITKQRLTLSVALAVIALSISLPVGGLVAQENPGLTVKAVEDAAKDKGWPRKFTVQGYEVFVHQPQIDEWKDHKQIFFRSAIVVGQESKPDEREYGVLRVSASTRVDFETRTVLLDDRKLEELRFPGVKPEVAEKLKGVVIAAAPPKQPMTISLDRLIAGMERSKLQVREAKVNLDPPPIFASNTPAVLVMFAGKPRFQKAAGTELLYAINTNWDVFLDTASKKYYLLNGDHWLVADDVLKGDWQPARVLSSELIKLPKDENWSDVRSNIPGKVIDKAPKVIVTTGPAELIVIDGITEYEAIPDTNLMMVSNTDADLFMHIEDKHFYFLTAGRWFKAADLKGPWAAATTSLPADFKEIPEDHVAAEVLPSVPGSPQAEEAIIQASIPQKATVKRSEVSVTVTYQGEPKFAAVESTTVQYAVNTPFKVFMVDGKYYCCHEGIWFVSAKATGPWIVSDMVPAAIYTIPATHPSYNVTYVHVYESTPETVVVGSTSGYSGQYVAAGVLLFGAGVVVGALLDNDDYWHYHYRSCYFSYGCGAAYHHHHGGFYAGGYKYYGPYGGGGGWAGYNPSTGIYSRGAYRYGPNGSAGVRTAYNPWTGNSGGQARVSTPYGSWGRTVVTDGDDWVRAGHRSNSQGSVAGIQGSGGAGAVKWENKYGNGATVARDKDGDVYVGKDGNIYKRDDEGGWSSRENGQWQKPANAPVTPRANTTGANNTGGNRIGGNTPATRPTPTTTPNIPRQTPTTRQQPQREMPAQFKDVDREARSRDRGAQSAQRGQQRQAAPQPRSRPAGGTRRK